MMAVAVPRPSTGNQAAEMSGGANPIGGALKPLKIIEASTNHSWEELATGMHRRHAAMKTQPEEMMQASLTPFVSITPLHTDTVTVNTIPALFASQDTVPSVHP